jgi:glycosyltransferase involved in cell wall biosynthesis
MRIAVVHRAWSKSGGAESYLDLVLPALGARGHQLAFLSQEGGGEAAGEISLPAHSPRWSIAQLGERTVLNHLRVWRPDLLFVNWSLDAALEASLLRLAPAVLFAHAYWGACISGYKRWANAGFAQCQRRLGWPCLLHYYPHRCGGLNPLRMARDFALQRRRARRMGGYRTLLVASQYVREEYIRQGLDPALIRCIYLPVRDGGEAGSIEKDCAQGELRLLFAGRMTALKGGAMLLSALSQVVQRLGRSLLLTLVGDGPERARWQAQAKQVEAALPQVRIHFAGWAGGAELTRWFEHSHLLIVPSLWPEPFGLIGPEAGLQGLPAVAFAVGGIPEWLQDGVNGALAPASQLNSDNLAEAIARCLRDPAQYARLRMGAQAQARRFALERHLQQLVELFGEVALNH